MFVFSPFFLNLMYLFLTYVKERHLILFSGKVLAGWTSESVPQRALNAQMSVYNLKVAISSVLLGV